MYTVLRHNVYKRVQETHALTGCCVQTLLVQAACVLMDAYCTSSDSVYFCSGTRTHTHTRTQARKHTHTYKDANTHTHTHTYKQTDRQTHTHTHTQTEQFKCFDLEVFD